MYQFATALAALSLIATPALAGQQAVTVRHADLDLSGQAGRAELDRRIAAATEQVCGSYAATTPEEQRAIKQCRRGVADRLAAWLAATRVARR